MSTQVPTTFVTLFDNNMKLALQQTQPILWPLLPERQGEGEKKQLDDLIGHVKAQKGSDDGRHGTVNYNNTPHTRVWVPKPDFDYYADLVDNNDQVQAKIQLTSGYMQTAVATINRAKDDAVLAGFFGSMITGKAGTTSSPFPSGNLIAHDVGGVSGTSTGLNVAKVRAARKLLAQNYCDMNEERFMLVTADDTDQLLNELPVVSKDFGADDAVIRDGKLRKLFGFTFVEMETGNSLLNSSSLVDAGSGDRKTPFWTKSGLYRVPWWDIKTSLDRLPERHGSIQVYASCCVAATRCEDGRVGYILNKTN